MEIDYKDLEDRFDCACKDVVTNLSQIYKSDYESQGPEKLLTFFELIQNEFDNVKLSFIRENRISSDQKALQSIFNIAKTYAKRCLDDYGKISAN
ncbi:hypothetical protein HYN59_12135 [Flavobacterium album]|uniref:Uncharacterized protein n=1 Tax=Flavobacterium album TaxID=2175091 RepID=A0A2S1QZW7_9FLAO|nr:hypothetical protein HYN59_12135 [Flavobacterium album]